MFIGSKPKVIDCDRVVYEHFYSIKDDKVFHYYDELVFFEKDPSSNQYYVQNYIITDEETYYKYKSISSIYKKVGDYHYFEIYLEHSKKYVTVRTKIFQEIYNVGYKDIERQNKSILDEKYRRSLW